MTIHESARYAPKDNGIATRKAYSYEPKRDTQGTAIDRLRSHADMVIANEDATTMNCGVFTDLLYVCNYIRTAENIKEKRVYPALCSLGRDRCYHEMKVNGGDVFTDIADMVKIGRMSIDNTSMMDDTLGGITIFKDVKTVKFRTTKQTLEIAVENAGDYGIKASDLNLYHTLAGLKHIVNNEPDYILLADKPVIKDTLQRLTRADNVLADNRERMRSWLRR